MFNKPLSIQRFTSWVPLPLNALWPQDITTGSARDGTLSSPNEDLTQVDVWDTAGSLLLLGIILDCSYLFFVYSACCLVSGVLALTGPSSARSPHVPAAAPAKRTGGKREWTERAPEEGHHSELPHGASSGLPAFQGKKLPPTSYNKAANFEALPGRLKSLLRCSG